MCFGSKSLQKRLNLQRNLCSSQNLSDISSRLFVVKIYNACVRCVFDSERGSFMALHMSLRTAGKPVVRLLPDTSERLNLG